MTDIFDPHPSNEADALARDTYSGVRVLRLEPGDAEAINIASLAWLDEVRPGQSARHGSSREQRIAAIATLSVIVVLGVFATGLMLRLLVLAATAVYLGALWHRVRLVRLALGQSGAISIRDAEALAATDDELATYTVLVPAYKEPEVIGQLLASLEQLDYPAHKLEVALLLEADDSETLAAAQAWDALNPSSMRVTIMVLPPGKPQTKPRALNFGLLCTDSELVTIYDAEDRPERLQLRRAALAFARAPETLACVQARLEFDDRGVNLLSKWFTLEYLTWFRLFIGGITSSGGVVPLGGTSNHFRRAALNEVGAWDPYNVTEDADLGVRLERSGYRVGLLDSVTLEEVNSDVVNWVKQRSRWMKGYLQTTVVHTQHPIGVARELGVRRSLRLLLFLGGTPALALLNLVFWSMFALWLITRADSIEYLFPSAVYYLALVSLVVGNLSMVYLSVVTLVQSRRHDHLLIAALTTPLYWVLIAIATVRAAIQLIVDPFYWEKTQHGIGPSPASGE